MPTTNAPFAYAVNVSGTIHLYLLVYSGATTPTFPVNVSSFGNAVTLNIPTPSSGANPFFKEYAFAVGSFDRVEMTCGGHFYTIVIADFDTGTTPAMATGVADKALDVPYTYTQKVDKDHFKIEVALFSNTEQRFVLSAIDPVSPNTNSSSEIDTTGTTATKAFYATRTVALNDFVTTSGAHESVVVGPGGRKSKTKNKNHSPTPFPGKKSRIKQPKP